MPSTLQRKTLFITGGSRGIGLAIAIRAARDGANIALIAKTAEPHPKLEGTIHTAAAAIEEVRKDGIAANCLWPRSVIATAAVQNLLGGDESMARARTPEIVADAAYAVLTQPARECTGNAFIDDDVLANLAQPPVTDLERY